MKYACRIYHLILYFLSLFWQSCWLVMILVLCHGHLSCIFQGRRGASSNATEENVGWCVMLCDMRSVMGIACQRQTSFWTNLPWTRYELEKNICNLGKFDLIAPWFSTNYFHKISWLINQNNWKFLTPGGLLAMKHKGVDYSIFHSRIIDSAWDQAVSNFSHYRIILFRSFGKVLAWAGPEIL